MFEVFKAKKKLGELEDRCEKLERDMKAVKLEWEDTYDRVKSLFHRIAKRAQRLEGDTPGSIEEAGNVGAGVPAGLNGLSERQRTANEQILKRRQRISEVKQ